MAGRSSLRCFALLGIRTAAAPPGAAATYHVAQRAATADDTGPGSSERPAKNLDPGRKAAKTGATVVIHGGVYREVLRPAASGQEGVPFVFGAAPGENVLLTGADRDYCIVSGFHVRYGANPAGSAPSGSRQTITRWTTAPSSGPTGWASPSEAPATSSGARRRERPGMGQGDEVLRGIDRSPFFPPYRVQFLLNEVMGKPGAGEATPAETLQSFARLVDDELRRNFERHPRLQALYEKCPKLHEDACR